MKKEVPVPLQGELGQIYALFVLETLAALDTLKARGPLLYASGALISISD
jgi:hypothetical protein